ncbi:TIGR00282 family metallophosphoesterase [Mycoplasma sp. SG1]|uniref:TIGR00282 family metallophosphoesterase n=1 Tax=Mycoplasma sp. SG1 TaxID=2810348 RepID=UPI0020249416|nr:TIGR00282 family metallophosphoesterase [Mycoplasma sp. SG1]URM53131.1 TIGR00282 family metallophosphoesterase [Mycoplasma sp. SG1]
MNVLVIGDVSGNSGKKALINYLKLVKNKYFIDFVVVNAENITLGKSINKNDYLFLKDLGINVITMGNHIYSRKDAFWLLENMKSLIRPINFYHNAPGCGSICLKIKNKKIRVTSILGTTFMPFNCQNPYIEFDKLLLQIKKEKEDIHIVDFHAETTSEKCAFAWNYDGKVTAVLGTHTHVQTADERILPKGTAFLTDIGMTGSYHSIIGVEPKEVIEKFKYGYAERFVMSNGDPQFCGVVLKIDNNTNLVTNIERILITPDRKFLF